VSIVGKGTAAVLYDADLFEPLDELAGVTIERVVPPAATTEVSPKSSCAVLLRRRTDALLVLLIALHLESAPPSDSKKVGLRQLQTRAALDHLSKTGGALAAAGQRVLLVLGGDFNALAPELLHGNSEPLWEAPEVTRVQPALRRPPEGVARVAPPSPPLARAASGGGGGGGPAIELLCEAADGGVLRQASHSAEVTCTRAGKNMVIDFLFVGTAGFHNKQQQEAGFSSSPVVLATAEESTRAADQHYGIYNAVMHWGSDHLPVGTEVTF